MKTFPRPLSVVESALDLVGRTPLLALRRFGGSDAAEIWGKCEFLNPGGSIKDRLGIGLIEAAVRDGQLRPGGTVIEPTAGNTGVGIALAATLLGFRAILVVPDHYSPEKQKVMKALGGTVVTTPSGEGMQGAIAKATSLASEIPGAFVPQQFANPENPATHYRTTGPEILEQMEARIDAVVIGCGSAGTFVGVARFLSERIPGIHRVAVETENSILTGTPGAHAVEGIGMSFLPAFWDPSLVDEVLAIGDAEAYAAVHELARTEGVILGGSSGANVAAARRVARRLGPGKRVVTVLPDWAERYMSKGLLDQ
jgi:cysteine synthase